MKQRIYTKYILKNSIENIDWVIVGGESGHKPRPMDPEWVIDIQAQCLDADVAFFFKQWGAIIGKGGCEVDGHVYKNCRHPILSYGILLFHKDKESNDYRIVMVERKDSLSYIEFIRGKYKNPLNYDYIKLLISRMTKTEKDKLFCIILL